MAGIAGRSTLRASIVLLLLIAADRTAAAYEPPAAYVPRLIANWEEQDASDRGNVGFALSIAFINWPSIFLREMDRHPDSFDSWLKSLEVHTASRKDEPGRGRRVIEQMQLLAARWDGVRYRGMAKSIEHAAAACSRKRRHVSLWGRAGNGQVG